MVARPPPRPGGPPLTPHRTPWGLTLAAPRVSSPRGQEGTGHRGVGRAVVAPKGEGRGDGLRCGSGTENPGPTGGLVSSEVQGLRRGSLWAADEGGTESTGAVTSRCQEVPREGRAGAFLSPEGPAGPTAWKPGSPSTTCPGHSRQEGPATWGQQCPRLEACPFHWTGRGCSDQGPPLPPPGSSTGTGCTGGRRRQAPPDGREGSRGGRPPGSLAWGPESAPNDGGEASDPG